MSIAHISLRLVGIGPMLMRNSRLGDPLDPLARQIAAVTDKRERTEADHLRVAELEFHGSLYLHNGAPCLPANMIKSVCVDGAKATKMGNTTKAAFRADGPALLDYDGPKTAPELWKDERFRYRTTVRIRSSGSLTVRTRPMFDGWSAVIHGTFLPSLLDHEDIVAFYRVAGLYGLGDYTPEFGRFQVEEVLK
ncbi:hypothetical protein BST63_12010 [Bradyrhizobium canariense]|uniref:Uncharacterized protein n=1 Tax=Bradyrhizobium canariense TaxID=255045 RepID=A0ABX3X666_9BRAD|nr:MULTISPECIES: hypothetical protein [Bradyrhizobium]OSJ18978.1 hypothetical protein BSR47_04915 [Bradyrhizobium canariense]OSJ30504.1 hypothetical protein BST63_12010 [Bradyrhizobium canariense]WOH61802.1 hypothetical protein RX329_17600 [Bradyrhizobium sp. BWC-3-1]